jgi:hypothetical protein
MNALYAGLAFVLLLCGAFWAGDRYEASRTQVSQEKGLVKDTQEVSGAKDVKAAETQNLTQYVAANPIAPVRVCRTVVQTIAPASPAASAPAADVQPVPSGNTGLRPDVGPDLSGLLNLLALRADAVAADLREQQAVP